MLDFTAGFNLTPGLAFKLNDQGLFLGRPLRYFIFSLMALIGDHIYEYFLMGFRGQPRFMSSRMALGFTHRG